jgi:aspartate-semialdehyde dehydrogenase
MGFKIAIAGATGNVGREMLNILAERAFPADEVVAACLAPFGRHRSLLWRQDPEGQALETYDFSDTDICLMSAGGTSPRNGRRRSARKGCVVIDNSSAWRYDADVPLIVPEVNADAIRLHQAQHHRQSELLDRPARRRAEAAA